MANCKYAKYCRHYSPQNVMCVGEDNNRFCPAACQFRYFNKDRDIDEDSVHIEARWRA